MSTDNLNRLVKSLELTGEYDIVHDSLNNVITIRWHRRKN